MPIRGMPDGLDARTAAVDSGCLCSILSQDLHKLDETARGRAALQLIATKDIFGALWDVVSLQIDRGAGHSGSGLQILKDWDNRDYSWVRARHSRRPLISAEEKLTARI